MKWYLLFFLSGFIACNPSSPSSGDGTATAVTGIPPGIRSAFMQDRKYITPLPAGSSPEEGSQPLHTVPVPAELRPLFYGLPEHPGEAFMTRFPDEKGYKVVGITYTGAGGYPVTVLYTFDNEWKPYGHLQVQSEELIEDPSVRIIQEYHIDEDYHIIETKSVNGLHIERLAYGITAEGEFAEIRDGKQPVVAYEIFTGPGLLTVESFTWQTSPTGALTKENLIQTTYHLNNLPH